MYTFGRCVIYFLGGGYCKIKSISPVYEYISYLDFLNTFEPLLP